MGTVGGKVGCGAALVVGLPLFGLLMFLNFYPTCGPADGPGCGEGDGLRFLIVLGIVAAVAAAVGLGVRFLVNRLAGPET
jgi:hypothetical protein